MGAFTLDTNNLIYSIDRGAGEKHRLAMNIMLRARRSSCVLMLQAASEFYNATTRKKKLPVAVAAAQACDWLDKFPVFAPTHSAVRAALSCAAEGRASYWDALLVASAAEAGCTAILTEDMADGTTLLGVRIVNPFAGAALSEAAATLLAAGRA